MEVTQEVLSHPQFMNRVRYGTFPAEQFDLMAELRVTWVLLTQTKKPFAAAFEEAQEVAIQYRQKVGLNWARTHTMFYAHMVAYELQHAGPMTFDSFIEASNLLAPDLPYFYYTHQRWHGEAAKQVAMSANVRRLPRLFYE
ncbi:MAG: hypothetical protein M9928_15665 [Anaerolineae bacterium]|nr:hypothetical protein [Anaerolineae bacterium]MCO5194549.1 hypothetical protein [Anaerolineae bacterium]MCO5199622.1 hypothetical protein [Anaerolineae bacterium]MCO5206474.1 hypothetical protein [Anaerolineae bacterium]